jgi:ProQ/FINO family
MSTPSRPTLTLSRPLDRLAAERLELAGAVQALPPDDTDAPPIIADAATPPPPIPADRAYHRRTFADAETVAWNRAREAEWHDAPAKLEALLRELAPLVFNDRPPPLAIGVHLDLAALLADEVKPSTIARFLHDWVRRPAYLGAVASGALRRDLDGHPTDAPDDAARLSAAKWLAARGVAS